MSQRLPTIVILMLETLRHMFPGVRWIDATMLLVEVAVLLLIAWDVVHSALRERKKREWSKLVLELMNAGHALLEAARSGDGTDEAVAQWIELVSNWIGETYGLLDRYSHHAASVFLKISSRGAASYSGVAAGAQGAYGTLVVRVDRLREIMENPDAYL